MVPILLNIILVILLIIVFIQDFKYRAITLLVFPIIIPLQIAISLNKISLSLLINHSIINFCLIIVQLASIFIYWRIKNSDKKFLNHAIGMGDILLLFVTCLAFSPIVFIVFEITGMILTLIVYSVLKSIKAFNIKNTIPLAGGISICYMSVLLVDLLFGNVDFLNDQFLLNLMGV